MCVNSVPRVQIPPSPPSPMLVQWCLLPDTKLTEYNDLQGFRIESSVDATRYGNSIARRVLGIGENVAVSLMHGAEQKPVISSLGTKCFDIRYIKNQLRDRLATSAPTPQGMEHDVDPGIGGTFQLDDAISYFSVDSETKMACVEFGDGFNVADVKQNSSEYGYWKKRLALLGHRKFHAT